MSPHDVKLNRRSLITGTGTALLLGSAEAPARRRVPATPRQDSFLAWLEVSPSALRHNVEQLFRHSKVPLWACVKAKGYNLGEVNVASAIDAMRGVAGFMCSRPDEAFNLADAGIRKPILLLAPVDDTTALEAARRGIRLAITAKDSPASVADLARRLGRPVPVHIDVDTGIHRQGVVWWEAPQKVAELHATRALRIEGIASYFANGAPGQTPPFEIDRTQIDRFSRVVRDLRRAGVETGPRHMVSSSSFLRCPEAYFEGVRCGALLYGNYTSATDLRSDALGLKQTYALKARLAQINLVKQGEGIGFGQVVRAERDTWVGLLMLGGIDGYRPNENAGGALVNGRFRKMAAITGTQMTLILGDRPDATVGDEAILIGAQESVRPELISRYGAWTNYYLRPDIRHIVTR